jgi:2-polyprenyl-6-hydroxyphenyl methylase/3-demethylubiquinone-9 3-methyltransferase
MTTRDTKSLESHFAFGENWLDYSAQVSQLHVDSAVQCMQRLLGSDDLQGRTFLDVGCGSGIHSVAAALLGADVTSVDLDPNCTKSTCRLADKFGVSDRVDVKVRSVFDLDPQVDGLHEIVYSWGVLHHTGAMWNAIKSASECTRSGGQFILSIYRKTRLCSAWEVEKRAYSSSPRLLQWPVQRLFGAAFTTAKMLKDRKGPIRQRREYFQYRGMNQSHDFHDWLGGYPYESARPSEIREFMADQGFIFSNGFNDDDHVTFGLFGSSCAEYLFKREPDVSKTGSTG